MTQQIPIEISVIVPVYNEANSIASFLARTINHLENLNRPYEIIFCLDPSTDNTETIIKGEIEKNKNIKLLLLSRRFGQAAATMAGIHYAQGQCCVTIDVDLQDPPELIGEMYENYQSGFDVVYTKRLSRKGETRLKLWVANWGYALINRISSFPILRSVGDYRLISKRVAELLKTMPEKNVYLRGLIAFIGFKHTVVNYHREKRHAGEGKYNPYTGSVSMGIDGVIGFSKKPLHSIFFLASCFLILFIFSSSYLFVSHFYHPISTLNMIITCLLFFTAVNLFALSIVAEYIARIHDDSKNRQLYIVDKFIAKTD